MTASPERRSPLGGWSERFASASAARDRFAIREVPFLTQVGLRGDGAEADFCTRVSQVLGFALPTAGRWSGSAESGALWLGPDEWLIVAETSDTRSLEQTLRDRLSGLHHSLVDVSANRTAIEIAGIEARLVLTKGMPLDLHADAFPATALAQSVLAKAQVILQCMDEHPTFRILVRPSFAVYLAEWLLDAAAECAASRGLDGNRLTARLS